MNDIAKLLAEALSHSSGHTGTARKRPAWDRRKVLVCASPAYREAIAESLISQDYDVFVAENMVQGLGRMREEKMDVIVLDASLIRSSKASLSLPAKFACYVLRSGDDCSLFT